MTREKSKRCFIAGKPGSLQKLFSSLKPVWKRVTESMLPSVWFGTLRLCVKPTRLFSKMRHKISMDFLKKKKNKPIFF